MTAEFELIQRFFSAPSGREDVLLSVGDDAALLDVGAAEALVLCVDTLVAGVHFPEDAPARDIGHKALAVNLSDLAAMGARPAWALLSLTLPQAEESWVAAFSEGFSSLARQYDIALVGGDTCSGPLSITVQVAGWVAPDQALLRSRACVGDAVYVSGSLGDAAAGLACWQGGWREHGDCLALIERLHRPQPRVTLGRRLLGLAHAAIDLSDGLCADLGHVLQLSHVGARVELARLPLSEPLRRQASAPLECALAGGDDYELCFTAPEAAAEGLQALAQRLGVALTRIGRIEAEPGLRLIDDAGREYTPQRLGYRHFNG